MDSSKFIFSADRRETLISELSTRQFDLVVVGGGITGGGIALDAASRGLSVALIEKSDFGSGTSSRSTKLIHGGLRYLKNYEFKLVKSVGKERAIVYKNAPHLVVPEKMLLPITDEGSFSKFSTKWGLWLYDRLAAVAKSERRTMLNKVQTIAKCPELREDNLKGAGFYSEYRTDDARLTLETIKTASKLGALAINYVSAQKFELIDGAGQLTCVDEKGNEFIVCSKRFVNATGPWVDEVIGKEEQATNKNLFLTKGVHLVFKKSEFPLEQSIYFDAPDGRMIFVIPRNDIFYLGTTDTPYNGDFSNPRVTVNDVAYLLNAFNSAFPKINLAENDIISSWAGLRPLIHEEGKSPSELSRKDEVFISKNGLISIAGGKLTGYRLMAKKIVDLVCQKLEISQECRTEDVQLIGGEFKHTDFVDQYILSVRTRLKGHGLNSEDAEFLVRSFGKQTDSILDKVKEFEDHRLIKAMAWFCLRNENVLKLSDFFNRRTGFLYFAPNRISESISAVASLFKEYFSYSEEEIELQIQEVKKELSQITNFPNE